MAFLNLMRLKARLIYCMKETQKNIGKILKIIKSTKMDVFSKDKIIYNSSTFLDFQF